MSKFRSIIKDTQTKQILIDSLCNGIKNTSEFIDAVNYIIENKIENINDDFLYDSEESFVDLILPSFRRAWGKVYIDPPTLFISDSKIKKERLELFQSLFNIDDFIDYLLEMLNKTKNCLSEFTHLDRTIEHITLIVDNYIAKLVNMVNESIDIKGDIREARLKKIL